MPVLLLSQAIPVFALAPLLVLWFGFGMASKIVMAVLVIFFPITAAFADGLRRTDRGWLDLAATMGATNFSVLRHVRLPASLPAFGAAAHCRRCRPDRRHYRRVGRLIQWPRPHHAQRQRPRRHAPDVRRLAGFGRDDHAAMAVGRPDLAPPSLLGAGHNLTRYINRKQKFFASFFQERRLLPPVPPTVLDHKPGYR